MKRLFFLVCLVSLPALADRAPWYRWQALNGRAVVCAQTMPPTEWRAISGPYVDSECRKLKPVNKRI